MRKVLRVMLWVLAVAGVLLVVAVVAVTNPVGERPFASGVSADPSRLQSDVEALTGLPGFRCYERPHDLDRAADWVRSALEESGLPVEAQLFGFGGRQFRNFIAGYGPEDAPTLVVGAHYDACGEKPGADDNASAVAGLLELARLVGRAQTWWPYRSSCRHGLLEEPPMFRTRTWAAPSMPRDARTRRRGEA